MMRFNSTIVILILLLAVQFHAIAQTEAIDSVSTGIDSTVTKLPSKRHSFNLIKRVIEAFNNYDTTYIEPNRYNWTVMLQGTTTAERFSLRDEQARSQLSFGSRPGMKIGPYLGWKFIFLGYTVDVTTFGKQKTSKTEFELSIYSNIIGADLIYRRTGTDFTLRNTSKIKTITDKPIDLNPYYGQPMEGVQVSMTGINLYYITNHRHFSLPAAFNQSTVQRKNAGSWKIGGSITRHDINVDYEKLESKLPPLQGNNTFQTSKMKYMDYSLSAGYAYNWVPARNWLISIDAAPSIGYKRTHRSLWTEEETEEGEPMKNALKQFLYSRGNFNMNFTGRFGVVWNNAHHYVGLSLILHNFNYRQNDLSMHNTFFTLNLYSGINFMRKKNK